MEILEKINIVINYLQKNKRMINLFRIYYDYYNFNEIKYTFVNKEYVNFINKTPWIYFGELIDKDKHVTVSENDIVLYYQWYDSEGFDALCEGLQNVPLALHALFYNDSKNIFNEKPLIEDSYQLFMPKCKHSLFWQDLWDFLTYCRSKGLKILIPKTDDEFSTTIACEALFDFDINRNKTCPYNAFFVDTEKPFIPLDADFVFPKVPFDDKIDMNKFYEVMPNDPLPFNRIKAFHPDRNYSYNMNDIYIPYDNY